MLNKLLYNYTAGLPMRVISLDSGPYLERYYLGKWFGITVYIHRFVSSDSERHVHNHPWRYGGSLILTGGYVEEIAVDIAPRAGPSGCLTEKRYRRWLNIVNGNTFHRIISVDKNTWTLFFHSKRNWRKGWGFFEAKIIDGNRHTVFTEANIGNLGWFKTAPKGGELERSPYE